MAGIIHMISRLTGVFRRGDPDCPEVRDAASDFIDGELAPARNARIRSHLDKCGPCAAFIRTLRTTVRLLRSTPRSDPPDGYTDRLRARLSREREI